MNPFTFGNPIKDPARFIGREAEIRQITNRAEALTKGKVRLNELPRMVVRHLARAT